MALGPWLVATITTQKNPETHFESGRDLTGFVILKAAPSHKRETRHTALDCKALYTCTPCSPKALGIPEIRFGFSWGGTEH